jgi:hypothetical protein
MYYNNFTIFRRLGTKLIAIFPRAAHKSVHNNRCGSLPRFSSSNICCSRCGHKEYVLQNMTSIDTSGFCQKVHFLKLITGSCSKKGGGSLCSFGQQNRVYQVKRKSTDDLRTREEVCNIITVRSIAALVCVLQQNRFAAGLALTACRLARLDAKETGVCDSCERCYYICCKKKSVCARRNTSYRGLHTAKVLDFLCV